MQQGNITSINWNNTNQFFAYINEGNIYQYDGQLVGVHINKYKEVEDALKKCKDKLIELGIIKMPKTPEEIIKEQTEMIEKQQALLNEIMLKMGGKEHGLEADTFGNVAGGQETTSNTDGDKIITRNKSTSNKHSK